VPFNQPVSRWRAGANCALNAKIGRLPIWRYDGFPYHAIGVQKITKHWGTNVTKLVFMVGLAASFLSFGQLAQAQIFGGVSDSGAVVLSNIATDEARTVVVTASYLLAPVSSKTMEAAGSAAKSSRSRTASAPPKAFQPFILEASLASRLPIELIHAVISAESSYNPHALSGKGAQGLMQLMPATARRFGSTNSLDPRDNILTGSRYLRWLMDYFNQDIELAVAAYNAGEGAVVRAGHKIPPYPETQKYVPKVLQYFRQASGVA
jgi:soluble lytic murein transglycosylase-like protein